MLNHSTFQRLGALVRRQVFSVCVTLGGVLVEQRSLHADTMHGAVRTLQLALGLLQHGQRVRLVDVVELTVVLALLDGARLVARLTERRFVLGAVVLNRCFSLFVIHQPDGLASEVLAVEALEDGADVLLVFAEQGAHDHVVILVAQTRLVVLDIAGLGKLIAFGPRVHHAAHFPYQFRHSVVIAGAALHTVTFQLSASGRAQVRHQQVGEHLGRLVLLAQLSFDQVGLLVVAREQPFADASVVGLAEQRRGLAPELLDHRRHDFCHTVEPVLSTPVQNACDLAHVQITSRRRGRSLDQVFFVARVHEDVGQ